MATSRTSRARSRSAARWFRQRVGSHLAPGTPTSIERHRPKTIGAGAGLLALVVLTTSVVACVSVWWVPAYLALMVLIFVVPQRGHQPASTPKPIEGSIDGIVAELGHDVRDQRTYGVGRHQLTSDLVEGEIGNDSTSGSVRFNPDLANTGITRPRRGRSRTRKAAKTATESAPGSSSVTWIRVGPGKFVRADTSVTATEQAQTEDMTTGANPATDVPVEMLPALLAPANAQAEQTLPCPQETSPGNEEIVISTSDRVQESITKEYGIAPSAFGPVPLTTRLIEGLAHGESEVAIDHEADSNQAADLCEMRRGMMSTGNEPVYTEVHRGAE